MIVEVDHPERGTFKTVGCPFKLSDSPVEIRRSPLLGEHSEEILDELRKNAGPPSAATPQRLSAVDAA